MASTTLEERVETLELSLLSLQRQMDDQSSVNASKKRGWKWFVGIYADSPDFDEVERIGKEWRNADRPIDANL